MLYWLVSVTVGWFAWMTFLSHQCGESTSRASRRLARDLGPVLPVGDLDFLDTLLRKAAHIMVFAVLAALVGLTLTVGCRRGWLPHGVAVLLLWCWLDEATKTLVPGRHFSWLDVGLNGVGVALGMAMVFWLTE